jgi:hypothetical protein
MKINQIIFLILFILLGSCSGDKSSGRISKMDLEINILRLEKDMFSASSTDLTGTIEMLMSKYGEFFTLFSRVINIGEPGSPGYAEYLNAFLTDKINYEVYEETLKSYPDLTDLEEQLSDAFKHYKHYFPDGEIPSVYSFVSRFNTSLIIGEGLLGIGLDRYLGTECKYYEQLGLTKYTRDKMHRDKIVPDCMYAWASTEWIFEGGNKDKVPSQNVLNHMIYQGKLIYFVQRMMPDTDENLIMGFSEDQMKWCRMNEKNMWLYLIEHKLLYDTEYMTINKLVQDGPFTTFFPRESPGRAAVWLGLQIVADYMKKHPDLTLPELMEETDYQKILTLSQYDP